MFLSFNPNSTPLLSIKKEIVEIVHSLPFTFLSPKTSLRNRLLANRKIIHGRPVSGKILLTCGVVKYFIELGFEFFLTDLPKEC